MAEPAVWGPSTWRAIHYVALGYPLRPSASQSQSYRDFFQSLGSVLPCASCAANYQRHLRELPLTERDLRGRLELFEWTVKLHNLVNTATGKRTWTVDEALSVYAPTSRQQRPTPERPEPVLSLSPVGIAVGISSFVLIGVLILLVLRTTSRRTPR